MAEVCSLAEDEYRNCSNRGTAADPRLLGSWLSALVRSSSCWFISIVRRGERLIVGRSRIGENFYSVTPGYSHLYVVLRVLNEVSVTSNTYSGGLDCSDVPPDFSRYNLYSR